VVIHLIQGCLLIEVSHVVFHDDWSFNMKLNIHFVVVFD